MTSHPPLLPALVKDSLCTQRFGKRFYYYPETDSTNDVAAALARAGENEGTVVATDYQRRGRGRGDHEWTSTAGRDLLFSLILRPDAEARASLPVTLALAVAMAVTLSKAVGTDIGVKWPNDIICPNGKVGGILAEGLTRAGRTETVVVGVGINVNSADGELPKGGVSCRVLRGEMLERPSLLADLLCAMESYYDRFRADGFAPLATAYNDRLWAKGRRVVFEYRGQECAGVVEGAEADGALRVSRRGTGDDLLLYNETIREAT